MTPRTTVIAIAAAALLAVLVAIPTVARLEPRPAAAPATAAPVAPTEAASTTAAPADAAWATIAQPTGTRREPVSPVIYPDQHIPLRFSHAQHLALEPARVPGGQPLTCTTCHTRAARSRSSLDQLIPGEATCRPCHAIDRSQPDKAVPTGAPPARCAACHLGDPAPGGPGPKVQRVVIPAPNLKFSHAAHVRIGMTCTACHGDLRAEGVALATRAQLPAMASCLACHDGRRAPAQCTTCHLAGPGGMVQTRYPSGVLAPSGAIVGDTHHPGFATEHRAVAQNNQAYCENCHRRDECLDCHSGQVKRFAFHPGNYALAHAVDARRNQPDCSSCHRAQSFCTGCHSRSGVSADGRASRFGDSGGDPDRPETGGVRFHPPGWNDARVIGPDHHGFAAQRNIRTCASCHREQFCVQCHTAEPSNPRPVNPHPPGWARSRRCQSLLDRNRRVCLRCHITAETLRCASR
ncbi:MAG: cytochrome c3 family protein [Myxococcota bacterium]